MLSTNGCSQSPKEVANIPLDCKPASRVDQCPASDIDHGSVQQPPDPHRENAREVLVILRRRLAKTLVKLRRLFTRIGAFEEENARWSSAKSAIFSMNLARPERFELPTPWFVDGALALGSLISLTKSAWRPLHLAPRSRAKHSESRKSPATTWRLRRCRDGETQLLEPDAARSAAAQAAPFSRGGGSFLRERIRCTGLLRRRAADPL